jgi:sugar (pentulose or hexulose) kinase
MNGERILALDAGTQSVRALVFDPSGSLLGRVRVPYEPYLSAHPGWAEQDPELYWRSLAEACRRLWVEHGIDPQSVAGVALTTQRGTVVNVDESGRPLRPAIVWLDQRRAEGLAPVGGRWGLIFRVIGARETIAAFQADAEMNWIRTHQPDIWAQTRHYLLLSGFLSHRLTGQFVDSSACQVGYLPFDYERQAWARRSDWKWAVAPIEPALLPSLIRPTEPLGEITPEAAEVTGIPAGRPLIAAAADKACEVLGSGALEPNVACLSYGTTATVNTTQRRYIEPIRFVPPYPSAVPDAYSLEVQVFRGYWMVEWFKREFGHPEVALAAESGRDVELFLDELLGQVPPGALGLMLQPYWSPGVREPGPEAKGAIIGFGDVHTRAHVYRAIIEGLAYALRDGLERIVRRSGVPVTELRVAGGGSRSDAVVQLTADVFGIPTGRPHTSETSGLGAAIDAAVGLGLHPDIPAAVQAMTRIGSVRDPDPTAHATYEELFRHVYRPMYRRLRPLYAEIRRITGYPGIL